MTSAARAVYDIGEMGTWPGAELRTPSGPDSSESLGSSVPKVIPKVEGSGRLLLIPGVPSPAYFTSRGLELVVGAGRKGG